eukprot:gb/GFBE01062283.1/.p1 GENE.gb/GFBE01062283.1/~~gb/GFBE01062283.1/.p1  ORF type:complete len:355 (+),score=29.95 gb/GFBE01062283.1/:1-1065(+)
MAGSLPLVGVTGIDSSALGAAGTNPTGIARQELGAPACSGALALRRVTTLLQGARRADAQGEQQQAKELYTEVLKVQKSLSRAPLGSFGKSLRDVAAGVEARLLQIKQEMKEEDGGMATSSRPATSSCSRVNSLQLPQSRSGGGAFSGDELHAPGISPRSPKVTSQATATSAPSWASGGLMECPLSARDGYDGRPATRDGVRPCTQEGAGRWRVGSFDGNRPVTRDGPSVDHSRQTLDGVRPSTRDGARLQQMIDGNNRRAAADGSSGTRPTTRDGVRPPTRIGTGERRAQDVSIRQVTGRKKRHSSQHAPEMLSLETAGSSPSPEPRPPGGVEWAPECLSPCMDADESVELLE